VSDLPPQQWERLLDRLESPSVGQVAEALADARDLAVSEAYDIVEAELEREESPLVEDTDRGAWGVVRVRDRNTGAEADESDATPTPDAEETGSKLTERPPSAASWGEIDFSTTESETWAPAQIDRDQWMCREGGKAPYAPWADADAPVECNHSDHDTPTTCVECEHHAGYKWGSEGSRRYVHADHDTAREWASKVPTLSSDLVFIQRESDPFAFVDGDDVRDPETDEVHPAFRAILDHLGVTYADVSTSGAGVHAVYRGEIPLDGQGQATFELDTEPWGANDDPPAVEIYANKHVCIATGDYLPGSGTEVREWDSDALRAILEANGYDDQPGPSAETDFDPSDHEPAATERGETTDDIRDIYAALDRLDARHVAEKTIVHRWNDSASTSGENRAFVPTWGPDANGTANIVDDEIWQDTGGKGYGGPAVMAAIDAPDADADHRSQRRDVSGATWWRAVEHLRDLGFQIPEYVDDSDEYDDDPRDADVVLDPRRAWEAAGRVVPDDLEDDLALPTTDDGTAWRAGGAAVDVVRAVATGDFDAEPNGPLDTETYDRAYRRARERYGAPLPEYVTEGDAADRYEVIVGAVRELDFHDLDANALDATVTDADDGGDVTHYIDPSAVDGWRDSEGGESVLVFDSGTVWDADTEETIDALRLCALDAGVIDSPTDGLEGGAFERAYRLAREEYGAPLPRWAIGTPEVEPELPPAEDLADPVPSDTDALEGARGDVESLYREVATQRGEVSVLQALPSLGKTTSAVKTAAGANGEAIPTAYLAPRKELMEQAAAKADRWGATWAYLPVFGGHIHDEALREGVRVVREQGKDLLRDRWTLADRIDAPLDPDENGDDSDTDLTRATCSTAEGDHGDAWKLVVHVARELDYTPRDIHERAEALFGTALPCQDHGDTGECEYSRGWDRISDPDDPLDLVIGSYVHANVESARTHYTRGKRDRVTRTERALALDEYPGDAFAEEFGPEFVDHAVWLASCLRDDVADRQDLFDADLWGDEWVRAWLRGDGADTEAAEACAALDQLAGVVDAAAEAREILDSREGFVETYGMGGPLRSFVNAFPDIDAIDTDRLANELRACMSDVEGQRSGAMSRWVMEGIVAPLDVYDGTDPLEALPETVSGELLALVTDAVDAAAEGADGSAGFLRAAATALAGGTDGCRELAVYADDGYAHRQAHRLLEAVITPSGEDGVADTIETPSFSYGDREGTRLKRVAITEHESQDTVLVDRDHEGATLLSPPSRTAGNGEECPVVGLDATARRRLWALMLGANVAVEDIHDSKRERARFARDVLGLQVVRTSKRARPYEGDPSGKDLDGDVALLEEIADEYAGVYGAGARDAEAATVDGPGVITTKCVRQVLEGDDRLADTVSAWDNYGNITGDNDLGDHRLAAILGTQHYGDHAVEKVAALAGEEVTRSGYGSALDYDSPMANTYLKHMREDQAMQAILRFTRGGSGAVVFAHTSALRDDLPVVGEGQVVKSWSDTAATVARAWKAHRGERFTVDDVASSVDVSRRQVRRVLDEFAKAGYLEKHDPGEGLANEFTPDETPSAGEVELPTDVNPDISRTGTTYTSNVRVHGLEGRNRHPVRPGGSPLPAPSAVAEGDPPP